MDAAGELTVAQIVITYRTDREPDTVTLGAFAQIAAKRRYGLASLKGEDPEVALFGAFVEVVGPAAAKRPPVLVVGEEVDDPFDIWLADVERFEFIGVDDDEDPTPAETPSSTSSDDSPPTSE